MSRPRLVFLLLLGLSSLAWSGVILVGQAVRTAHHAAVATVRNHQALAQEELLPAIADYQRLLSLFPCRSELVKDVALLLALKADRAALAADAASDAALADTQALLAERLSCTPLDGKAWLDDAGVAAYREGFARHALESYKMSAVVAPGESWLAEKRLMFALSFRALFDAQACGIAAQDVAVLARAHPNRMKRVLMASRLDSQEALSKLFCSPQ